MRDWRFTASRPKIDENDRYILISLHLYSIALNISEYIEIHRSLLSCYADIDECQPSHKEVDFQFSL